MCSFPPAVVYGQVDPDLRRLCNAQTVCGDCILASPLCVWCADTVSPREFVMIFIELLIETELMLMTFYLISLYRLSMGLGAILVLTHKWPVQE